MPFKLAAGEERQGADLQPQRAGSPHVRLLHPTEGQPADAGSVEPLILKVSSALAANYYGGIQ